jgi:hypothetical protein
MRFRVSMPLTGHLIPAVCHVTLPVRHLLADFARLAAWLCRSHGAPAAGNLFLRKQLALFQERKLKPHRATGATSFLTSLPGRFLDWRSAQQPRTSA